MMAQVGLGLTKRHAQLASEWYRKVTGIALSEQV
jgi:hypothetical protein